jgi:hypothetical protein
MAWGALIFAVAFIDEAVLELQNRRIAPVSGEALRNE